MKKSKESVWVQKQRLGVVQPHLLKAFSMHADSTALYRRRCGRSFAVAEMLAR